MDLRDIVSTGGYPSEVSTKLDFGDGLVMQLTNIRNISAPKSNQESKTSPRLLQIDMTDGQTYCSGLEMEHLPNFNTNIAPGTKVLLQNSVRTIQGIMSLAPQNITVLGGKVATIYEKWEANRAIAKMLTFGARTVTTDSNSGGPPPWIPFGKKAHHQSEDGDNKSFKSYGAGAGEKTKQPSKENTEFVSLRNEAIDQAVKMGIKKKFGGGNQQLMDHNVKKILEKGYTEEQAKYALKMARNNLERAMNSLKRRNANEADPKSNEFCSRGYALGRDRSMVYQERSSGAGRGGRSIKNEAIVTAKPSGKVSLFDYLEDKIKIPESSVPTTTPTNTASLVSTTQSKQFISVSNYNNNRSSHASSAANNARYNPNDSTENNNNINNIRSKFENNISTSFASRQKKDEDFSHIRPSNQNNNSLNSHHRSLKQNELGAPPSSGFSGKGSKSSCMPFPALQQQSQHYNRQKNIGNDGPNQYRSNNRFEPQLNQKYVYFWP